MLLQNREYRFPDRRLEYYCKPEVLNPRDPQQRIQKLLVLLPLKDLVRLFHVVLQVFSVDLRVCFVCVCGLVKLLLDVLDDQILPQLKLLGVLVLYLEEHVQVLH